MKAVVIDDSPISREQIRAFFEDELSYKVAGFASNGEEAITLIEKHDPELIILDMDMPQKSGIAVLEEIISIRPSSRVIMMVEDKNKDQIDQIFSKGAQGFISKPFRFNTTPTREKVLQFVTT